MQLARSADNRILDLFRQGLIRGTVAGGQGNEGLIVPLALGHRISNFVHIARDLIDHQFRWRVETIAGSPSLRGLAFFFGLLFVTEVLLILTFCAGGALVFGKFNGVVSVSHVGRQSERTEVGISAPVPKPFFARAAHSPFALTLVRSQSGM